MTFQSIESTTSIITRNQIRKAKFQSYLRLTAQTVPGVTPLCALPSQPHPMDWTLTSENL